MQSKQSLIQNRRRVALGGVMAVALMGMACAGLSGITPTLSAAATAVAVGNNAPTPQTVPQAGSLSSAQCQVVGAAYIDFEGEYPFLGIASDDGYASNTPDSLTYINIPKLNADLDALSTLPDGSFGTTAAAVGQIRQLVDQVDSNIKSGGKPFSDGSGNGQKVLDLYLKLAVPYTAIAESFGTACPDYSAPTAASDVAGFKIGQTAPVGDLRVTLDSVAEAPLEPNNLPTTGNRFLIVHVTIQNVGQTDLQVTAFSETNLKDAAGTAYGFDPFANSLGAVTGDNALDATIPAGGTHTGAVAYQVPASAGDLLWIFHDFSQTQAIFAVKASDIDTSQAGSAPTEDALRDSAGATMTAFFDLIATSESMEMTATAAP
jgi:Domain of unknown function (DUF4352)